MSAEPPEVRLRVLLLSHSPDLGVFKVGSHHLARELAERGHRVAHVSTPVSLPHLAKLRQASIRARFRAALRARLDCHGVLHVVPLSITPATAPLPPWRHRLNLNLARHRVRRHLGGQADVTLIDQVHLDGFDSAMSSKSLVIYRPTDVHFDRRTQDRERRLLERADGLIATSEVVRQEIQGLIDRSMPSAVIENGVDVGHFSSPPGSDWSDRDGFVYVGALDERFDWVAVRELALAHPDHLVTIAGPTSSAPPPLPPNVDILGSVDYSDVPAILRRARVGILPMSAHQGNSGRSPMKYYEYLAAGLWVLATSSPVLRRRQSPGTFLVESLSGWREVSALAIRHSDVRENVEGARHAREFSWAMNAERIERFVAEVWRRRP